MSKRKFVFHKSLSIVLAIVMILLSLESSNIFAMELNPASTNNLNIGDYVQMGSYENEPILWRVIDLDKDGDPMLFSDKILSLKSMNAIGEIVEEWEIYGSIRESGSSYWKNSNLRQWLNSREDKVIYNYNEPVYHEERGFLSDENFTQEEKSIIKKSTNKLIVNNVVIFQEEAEGGSVKYKSWSSNIKNYASNYDDAFYVTTEDQVFLLSIKEFHENVWENRHILGEDYYKGKLSKASIANNPYDSKELIEDGEWSTTLRTQGYLNFSDNISINPDGKIDYCEASNGYRGGIRPALRLRSPNFIEGVGTKNSPYIVKGGKKDYKPLITLNGDSHQMIKLGDNYLDEGAKGWSYNYGDLTNQIVVSGLPIDTSKEGIHKIKYNLMDNDGNMAMEIERTVVVSNVQIGDYIEFGKYEGEPILWRVIHIDEEGSPILLSDKILTLKSLETYSKPYDKLGNLPNEEGDSFWGNTTLRTWLNSSDKVVRYDGIAPLGPVVTTNAYAYEKGFLADGNFTLEERELIKARTNKVLLTSSQEAEGLADGGHEPYLISFSDLSKGKMNYETSFYKNVTDKVSLLSDKDVYDYIMKNEGRLGDYVTAYPRPQTVYSTQYIPYERSMRLLSPYLPYWYSRNSMPLYYQGSINADGAYGVRPTIGLKSINLGIGNGKEESPYRINMEDDKLKNLIVDPTSGTMRIGERLKINAYGEPFYAKNEGVTWESSNTEIVTIDNYGNMVAKNSGRTNIKAASLDGNLSVVVPITVVPENTKNGMRIGDYINFGKYNEKPILWRIININEDGSPMLLSDRILTLKAFDAKGENSINRDDPWNSRKQNGGNLWQESTLRQWLNSSNDNVEYKYNSPNKLNVAYNSYDDEKGFFV